MNINIQVEGAGYEGPIWGVQNFLHTNTQTDRQHTEKVNTEAPLIASTLPVRCRPIQKGNI